MLRARARVIGHNERTYVAAWYPQMGGYAGKCWIELRVCLSENKPTPTDEVDVHVFHDGTFPFKDSESGSRPPVVLHHCSAAQFIKFGELVNTLQGAEPAATVTERERREAWRDGHAEGLRAAARGAHVPVYDADGRGGSNDQVPLSKYEAVQLARWILSVAGESCDKCGEKP